MKVTNRFKGLDPLGRMPEELWIEVCNIVQEVVTKTIPKKKKCVVTKWLSEEAVHTAEEKKTSKKQGRKGKIHPTECRVPENNREKLGLLK